MCIPTRTRFTYNNDKPWFTAKLRRLRQAKEDAYRKGDTVLYKQAKYTLEKECLSVRTLLQLSILRKLRDGRKTWKVKYTRAFRLLLLIGNVLKMDSKTKPTSKINYRVKICIYKLGQECKKRHLLDILISFELWMNMTKLHLQHFIFFTAHQQKTLMLILHYCYYKKYAVNKLSV